MGSCSCASPAAEERRHEGRVAVDARNTVGRPGDWLRQRRRVRVAFALDCCDREAMSFVATTGGITGEDVRDLLVAAFEHRFGRVNRLPADIEWLTRRFAREVGLVPCTTPLESPQSNGMAEAFVRTLLPRPGRRDRAAPASIPAGALQPSMDASRCKWDVGEVGCGCNNLSGLLLGRSRPWPR
jgi:transposase InsO family protein